LSRINNTYQASPQNFFSFSYGESIGERAAVDFLYVKDNHLGNVLVTVSDKKLPVPNIPATQASYYMPDVISTNDYYSFGSLMPGRNQSTPSYRYGFNGQEKTDEIYGVSGSHNTAKFWEYDTRTGRRWNLDPVTKAWESGYAVMGSNPIWNKDPNGDDFENVHTERKEKAKGKRDEAVAGLDAAKEGFKQFEGMTKKEAKASGKINEYKNAKSELSDAQRNFTRAEATYQQEVKFEKIVQQVFDNFKAVNPEKFAEFNKFNPYGTGVIDIPVSAQNEYNW